MTKSDHLWSVPVALGEVPESGLHFDLVADEPIRAAIMRFAGVDALPRLEAAFDVTRQGRGGLRVCGVVSGTVGQTCVVTLDPMENEIHEEVDLSFAPPGPSVPDLDAETVIDPDEQDPPEPLVDGTIDLGRIATEFLVLAIEPYPRKEGAVFTSPAKGEGPDSSFAGLAALKKGGSEGE